MTIPEATHDDRGAILLESGTNEVEIVEFTIDKVLPDGTTKTGYFGINVSKVKEIIQMPKVTDYPNGHSQVLGIATLRNDTVPLIDLAGWLGIPTQGNQETQVVIVTDFNRTLHGFCVTSVNRIHRESWADVQSPSAFLESTETDCVVAVVRKENRTILILDFEKIIADINPAHQIERYTLTNDHSVDLSSKRIKERSLKTVLLVEDSAFIRKKIEEVVREAGYLTVTAHDGQEGWDMLNEAAIEAKEANAPISDFVNCVISDVEMPRMDGMHLTKKIRDDGRFNNIPIIIFSSIMSEENSAKALALGANETITKPEINKMTQLLDKHLLSK